MSRPGSTGPCTVGREEAWQGVSEEDSDVVRKNIDKIQNGLGENCNCECKTLYSFQDGSERICFWINITKTGLVTTIRVSIHKKN